MGPIDPVIGRDDEIDQTVRCCPAGTKNNPVLIGEAGVGKTAIVEGSPKRSYDDDVPATLLGKRVRAARADRRGGRHPYRGLRGAVKRIIDEIRDAPGRADHLHR